MSVIHFPVKEIEQAVQQLERSERGQLTCKLLFDFLKSSTVQGLDFSNSAAVELLIHRYMLGDCRIACKVCDELAGVIERNKWIDQLPKEVA